MKPPINEQLPLLMSGLDIFVKPEQLGRFKGKVAKGESVSVGELKPSEHSGMWLTAKNKNGVQIKIPNPPSDTPVSCFLARCFTGIPPE